MKAFTWKYFLMVGLLLMSGLLFAQMPDVVLQSGNYDKDPYPNYNPTGSVRGTYSIQIAKSAHTFTDGQFTINVAFPVGAVYAGGGTIPSEFSVVGGQDGSSFVVIGITGTWSGTGPTAIRNFVLPIKIVAPASDEPTVTSLQWLDPFVTENTAGNSTGSPLNVENSLPVTLAGFDVKREGSVVNLHWVTTQEINSDFFQVQHSRDCKQWEVLGSVESHKASKERNEYSYTHTTPIPGQNYYRLKMVDLDLTYAYSSIKSVVGSNVTSMVKIFPNPSINGQFTIQTTDSLPVRRVELLNSAGICVYQILVGKVSSMVVPTRKYPAGTYLTRLVYEDGSSSIHRVVIAK